MKTFPQAKPFVFFLALLSVFASSLACQIGGQQISDEEMEALAADVMSVSMLAIETVEIDGDTLKVTTSWPIEMDPPTFSAALLDALLALSNSFPDVETVEVGLRQLDQSFLSIEVSMVDITALALGDIEPNTTLERMTVRDQRPDPMLLRHELEADEQRVLRLESADGVLYVDFLVAAPFESSEGLIEQWVDIFELLNLSDLDADVWRIRWLLPDYSVTEILVNRADYQAYEDGTLDAVQFLSRINSSHNP
jgi:hypothetical protein